MSDVLMEEERPVKLRMASTHRPGYYNEKGKRKISGGYRVDEARLQFLDKDGGWKWVPYVALWEVDGKLLEPKEYEKYKKDFNANAL